MKIYRRNPWSLQRTWTMILPALAILIFSLSNVSLVLYSVASIVTYSALCALMLSVILYFSAFYTYVIVDDTTITLRGEIYRFIHRSYRYDQIGLIRFVGPKNMHGYPSMKIYTEGKKHTYYIELVSPDQIKPLIFDLQNHGVEIETVNMGAYLKEDKR